MERLSSDDIDGDVEELGDLEDCVDMPSACGGHMMGRAGFAPAIGEFPRPACKACAHIRVAESEDRPVFVDAFRDDEAEMAIFVLSDA